MKRINVPPNATIEVETPKGWEKVAYSFLSYLKGACVSHKKFGTWDGVDQGIKIKAAIESHNGTILLEDGDYNELLAAVKSCQYHPGIAMQVPEYKRAVQNAEDVAVEEVKPEARDEDQGPPRQNPKPEKSSK